MAGPNCLWQFDIYKRLNPGRIKQIQLGYSRNGQQWVAAKLREKDSKKNG